MLPKTYRLPSNRILDIIKSGRRVSGKYMYIKYLPSDTPRCAIVVPKKYVSCNVKRNIVKRWIRHAFMDVMKENLLGSHTMVIGIYNSKEYGFAEILQDLRGVAVAMNGNRG